MGVGWMVAISLVLAQTCHVTAHPPAGFCSRVRIEGATYASCDGEYLQEPPSVPRCSGSPQWRHLDGTRFLYTLGGGTWIISSEACAMNYFHLSTPLMDYPWDFGHGINVSCVDVIQSLHIVPEQFDPLYEGDPMSAICSADCYPACNFRWINQDGDVLSEGSILNLNNVTAELRGNITCQAANRAGTLSGNAFLDVLYGPVSVSVAPSGDVIGAIENDTVRLDCIAECNPPCTTAWSSRSDRQVAPSSGGVLTIPRLGREDTGVYVCHANNSLGSDFREVTLRIYHAPENITLNSSSAALVVDEGNDVTITCSATCFPTCQFYWTFRPRRGESDDRPSQPNDVEDNAISDDVTGTWPTRYSPISSGVARDLPRREDKGRERLIQTGDLLNIPDIRRQDEGRYRCMANNSLESVEEVLNIYVHHAPGDVTLNPAGPELHVTDPNSAVIRCSADCSPLCDFRWEFVEHDQKATKNDIDSENEVLDPLPESATRRVMDQGGWWDGANGEEEETNDIGFLSSEGATDSGSPNGETVTLLDNSALLRLSDVTPVRSGKYRCTATNRRGSSSKWLWISTQAPKVGSSTQAEGGAWGTTWKVLLPVLGLVGLLLTVIAVGVMRRRKRRSRNAPYQEDVRRMKRVAEKPASPSGDVTSRARVENAYSDIWNNRITLNFEVTDTGLRTTVRSTSDEPTSPAVKNDDDDVTDVVDMKVNYFRDADCGDGTSDENYLDMSGHHSDGDHVTHFHDTPPLPVKTSPQKEPVYQNSDISPDQVPNYLILEA